MSRAVAAANLIASLAAASPGKRLLERRLGQLALGVLASLREGGMSPDSAARELFNSDNYLELKRRRLDRRLVELFEWGMELPDVSELVPAALADSLDRMDKLAAGLLGPADRPRPQRVRR
ncbi:MAG TPA: DUF3969 family protein [Tepidisphaeraceae bacterium]|nr:DUF3969 family protein [Tepidisphaeraceae bacterium]